MHLKYFMGLILLLLVCCNLLEVVYGIDYHDTKKLKSSIKYYAFTRQNLDKPVAFKLSMDSIARSGLNFMKETT